MILDWLAQSPVVLAALILVFVPGVVVLFAVGMRGLILAAAAPVFTVAATSLLALGLGAAGIPWSPTSWAVGMLIMAVIAAALGRLLGTRLPRSSDGSRRWVLPVAVVVGATFGLWRLAAYIADPAGISQTNDAVFHMNAVRFILDTADASSLSVNGVVGGSSFYPAAWHALVSLVVLVTGAGVPVAANALTLVIGALIWPLGIAALTRIVTGSDRVAGTAAILSSALQTFPLLMFQWGVLFPNALSTSMLPAAAALVLATPAWARATPGWRGIVRGILVMLFAFCALLFAQPATLLPWFALILVRFTAWTLAEATFKCRTRSALAIGAWVALGIVWILLSRNTSGSHWPPFRNKFEVFVDVLLNGHIRIPFAIGMSVLMLCGLVVAWRQRSQRWFVFVWLGASLLYVLVASVGAPIVRDYVLGAWYADPYRIAALAPIAVIPLSAIGLCAVIDAVDRTRRRRLATETRLVATSALPAFAVASVAMIVLIVVRSVAMPAVIEGSFDRDSRYISASDSYLSPDERTLLEALPGEVDADTARVIANPSTGSGFGYMLSGVDVYPKTWSAPRTQSWDVLAERLREAGTDPEVCAALEDSGSPGYVLDFGLGDRTPGRYEMPGMTDFAGQPGFSLVASVGDASLWRITACAR